MTSYISLLHIYCYDYYLNEIKFTSTFGIAIKTTFLSVFTQLLEGGALEGDAATGEGDGEDEHEDQAQHQPHPPVILQLRLPSLLVFPGLSNLNRREKCSHSEKIYKFPR